MFMPQKTSKRIHEPFALQIKNEWYEIPIPYIPRLDETLENVDNFF